MHPPPPLIAQLHLTRLPPSPQAFVDTWEELDEDGSGFIEATALTALLTAVPPPVGVQV